MKCDKCDGTGNTIVDHFCHVCFNTPDEDGVLYHGKGCYVVDEDGGGSETGFLERCTKCDGKGEVEE